MLVTVLLLQRQEDHLSLPRPPNLHHKQEVMEHQLPQLVPPLSLPRPLSLCKKRDGDRKNKKNHKTTGDMDNKNSHKMMVVGVSKKNSHKTTVGMDNKNSHKMMGDGVSKKNNRKMMVVGEATKAVLSVAVHFTNITVEQKVILFLMKVMKLSSWMIVILMGGGLAS
jgi:hypothetical protein